MSGFDDEMILIVSDKKKFKKNTWIADSGATTHMCNDLEGMFDLEEANISISVGNGQKMTTKKLESTRVLLSIRKGT